MLIVCGLDCYVNKVEYIKGHRAVWVVCVVSNNLKVKCAFDRRWCWVCVHFVSPSDNPCLQTIAGHVNKKQHKLEKNMERIISLHEVKKKIKAHTNVAQLAKDCGISRPVIYNMLNGTDPRYTTYKALADYFDEQ